ncbi:MAG TPA: HD domain-containing phosphohydrolase [Candidatus Omnitrophota bacterium]|nr:HD domain-containing phosphohydrolase [Candidatus Omnitrophota bacterium]HRZ15277.1 HD domain-containing phosphohydrolase [Candidatus Omnitrophota bacterium]
MLPNNRILLLIHNEDVLRYLREQLIIEGGYSIVFSTSSEEGLNLFRQESFDLVIAGVDMPGFEGPRIVKELKLLDSNCVVILFLEKLDYELLEQAKVLGIYDYITKPINAEKLFFLLQKGIERHGLLVTQNRLIAILKEQNTSLQKQNVLLAKRIEESTRNLSKLYEDLRSVYMRTIRVLAQAIDARDHYTHDHSEKVSRYSVAIGKQLGLTLKEIEMLRDAAELHDLGKIGIEDNILSKPSGLTPQEWEQVKLHPEMGAQILEPLTFLSDVIELVRQHHEHFDGRGYPAGKRGEEILLGARIIHLADAYEAMTAARSYRKVPLTKEEAVAEINRNANTQFDPHVVEAFLKVVDEL